MTWQDALQAKVQRMLDAETDPYAAGVLVAVQMCIDDTAAEHPELVDLSLCGPQCPAYHDGVKHDCTPVCWAMPAISDAPTGHPCPVLAARKGAT